ncbi:MAG: cobalt-precorrin-6A reductase, partial [Pseudomonadota bacterium]
AGRVERPAPQPVPVRVGGFGGASGLAAFLTRECVSHLIDATHPFAAQMSANAVEAAEIAGVPLLALTRPAWRRGKGDDWIRVKDMGGAVAALDRPRSRVMLAIGRQHLKDFAPAARHFYLLRLVDPPEFPMPLPDYEIVVDRGPFTAAGDRALMIDHGIELVVSKNSGGTGARAKLLAARDLGLPVIMVDRPKLPPRREVHTLTAAMDWIGQGTTARGV